MVDNQTKIVYNTRIMKIKEYPELTKICGGNITPKALKGVFLDLEFQTSSIRQEFWEYMFEMGNTFGDIQSFVVQDKLQQGAVNV